MRDQRFRLRRAAGAPEALAAEVLADASRQVPGATVTQAGRDRDAAVPGAVAVLSMTRGDRVEARLLPTGEEDTWALAVQPLPRAVRQVGSPGLARWAGIGTATFGILASSVWLALGAQAFPRFLFGVVGSVIIGAIVAAMFDRRWQDRGASAAGVDTRKVEAALVRALDADPRVFHPEEAGGEIA